MTVAIVVLLAVLVVLATLIVVALWRPLIGLAHLLEAGTDMAEGAASTARNLEALTRRLAE